MRRLYHLPAKVRQSANHCNQRVWPQNAGPDHQLRHRAPFDVSRPSRSLFWKGFSDYHHPLRPLSDYTHPLHTRPYYVLWLGTVRPASWQLIGAPRENESPLAPGLKSPQLAHGHANTTISWFPRGRGGGREGQSKYLWNK